MLEQIWEILTTLTEDAQSAALSKSESLNLDQNKGIVSLNESFINLTSATNLLKDAIEKRKLIQLPYSIQKIIHTQLEAISKSLISLMNGSDEIINLTQNIENLNLTIWQYRLNDLSKEVLGYNEKLNQLKQLESDVKGLRTELKKGFNVKSDLETILITSKEQLNELSKNVEKSTLSEVEVKKLLTQLQESTQNVSSLLMSAEQNQSTITQLVASIKQANTEAVNNKEEIQRLLKTFEEISKVSTKGKEDQIALVQELNNQKQVINDLLGDANRTGMAAAYRNKTNWLILPLIFWFIVFLASIGGLIYIEKEYLVMLLDNNNISWAQLAPRLALNMPFIWLGWFSAKQYGYTSKLRQDYAYKTTSAMSFEGYKRETSSSTPEMLNKLLDTAIKNFGDNPIRIYSSAETHTSPLNEALERSLNDKKFIDLIKAIISKVKP